MGTDMLPIVQEGGEFLDVLASDPFDDDEKYYRYHVIDEKKICVEKLEKGQVSGKCVNKTLWEIIWKNCKLERVCSIYGKQFLYRRSQRMVA